VPRRRRGEGTRLFFAADLHGSEPAWRKFVNAAAFYDVDALVFGGDLMGKALVPIVRENGSMRAELHGHVHRLDSRSALADFVAGVEVAGYYWRVMDPDEYERLSVDPLLVDGTMQDLARERLHAWISFAEDRLRATGVRVYLTGGNDDAPSVVDALDEVSGDVVVASEGRVVDLDDTHTMITVGLSTPTPWDTPREASEDEIRASIDASAALVPDLGRCVFNLHCPPKDTVIDRCVKLDRDHVAPGELPRPVREAGRFVMTGGGSVAVREAIREYQPLVALHGHIHESPGRVRIGRSPCFNPGSQYGEGRLEGVVVQLRDARLGAYQHTSG
jgi:Icc-related predicted phosphoesterase